MADVQKQFFEFDEKIRLKRFDENVTLIEKRDIVLDKLRGRLKKMSEDDGIKRPSFEPFNQGSYKIGTGIIPEKGDYDIDVGLIFNMNKDDFKPVDDVKNWVYEALNKHTDKVELRKPCITVYYQKAGENLFHLDLAIYAKGENDDELYLATGKPGSVVKEWKRSYPKELIEKIENKFSDNEKTQFKRIVRCLKRWKNLKFPIKGNSEPLGIAITIAALNYFQPNVTTDFFTAKTTFNDLQAMYDFVNTLIGKFTITVENGEFRYRIQVFSPVEPSNDFFSKMTLNQTDVFKSKLEALRDNLKEAIDKVDPSEACELLSKREFGDDFPIPEKKDTRTKVDYTFPPSSSSALQW